ncbi:MAG: threonine synthase [Euryarchaeota archaeon]|nr:threonine synthase [Euryarchaeota archaeon]
MALSLIRASRDAARVANLSHLECSACGRTYDIALRNLCPHCERPLLARYELDRIRREDLLPRNDLWRYFPLLPVDDLNAAFPLGEGGTPLVRARNLGASLGLPHLYVKDESANPTGTFKARGMAVAVPMAKTLGATKVAVPSAGNAGSAMAAYAAKAGLEALVVMPRDTPAKIVRETAAFPARLFFVDGLITDAAAIVKDACAKLGYFHLATLQEPYRVEGKKTMGFELWEQLRGLPDWVVFPTGGGTGVVGLWKAFEELRALGWHEGPPPKIAFVQSTGCAPLVRAFEEEKDSATEWKDAKTIAAGLRVPRAVADTLVLRATRATGGRGVAVTDPEMIAGTADLARLEGIYACYEGGATVAALRHLVADGVAKPDESVVVFNTGTGLKNPTTQTKPDVPVVRDCADLEKRLRG